jgi:hypothetical protein
MAWGIHYPKECRLGAQREDKKEDKANSVAAAAAAVTIACP